MDDCWLCLFALSLVGGFGALTVQSCSSVSCEHTGNATLNTSEVYRTNKSCDWSLTDENNTTVGVVTPSRNVSVSCNRSEVYLKVHCDTPKFAVYCYKLNRTKNDDGTPSPLGASHSRTREFVLTPMAVFVMLLIGLAIRWKMRRQSPVAENNRIVQNNRESSCVV